MEDINTINLKLANSDTGYSIDKDNVTFKDGTLTIKHNALYKALLKQENNDNVEALEAIAIVCEMEQFKNNKACRIIRRIIKGL